MTHSPVQQIHEIILNKSSSCPEKATHKFAIKRYRCLEKSMVKERNNQLADNVSETPHGLGDLEPSPVVTCILQYTKS